MGDAQSTYLLWAVSLGALSAVSLPLGSVAGLALRPPMTVAAMLAAFGAGALIAALAVELVAPTVEAAAGKDGHPAPFWALCFGAVAGGLLFVALDRVVASRGGFLRKVSTTITWFTRREHERHRALLEELCAVPLLRMLPAEQVGLVVRDVRPRFVSRDEILFREGDDGDALYFVRSGEIEIRRKGEHVCDLGPGSVLGEIALVGDVPRTATARAKSDVEVLALERADFDRWRAVCPELDTSVRHLASQRLSDIREREARRSEAQQAWGEAAVEALREGTMVPSPAELRAVAAEHHGAPLAVWLGILIDGIPESIVIGAGLAGLISASLAAGNGVAFLDVVPYTLIAGLFLSNFPEALSSSMGMRVQGWTAPRVVGMWVVLLVVTAVGSGLGFWIAEALPHVVLSGVEGVAAGAMLTMIASTMIPEAVQLAGSNARVGLATLFGFLAAVSFKLLE